MIGKQIRFGSFTLDLAKLRLYGPSGPLELRPKTYEVLKYLVENRGRVVSKDELLNAVWPEVTVGDDALTHCISEARRAMGLEGGLIETVPRRGYMFVADTAESAPSSDWEKRIAKRADLLPFARRHQLAVIATQSSLGMPQAAVVRFVLSDAFEVLFTTHREHRKVANLRANSKASAVIGWDEAQTLQLEGWGDLLTGSDLEAARTILIAQAPDHYEARHRIEGLHYVRITPTWIRYSDFRLNPASILTLDLISGTESRSARLYRAESA